MTTKELKEIAIKEIEEQLKHAINMKKEVVKQETEEDRKTWRRIADDQLHELLGMYQLSIKLFNIEDTDNKFMHYLISQFYGNVDKEG